MVMKLRANGSRIRELRTDGLSELPQKTLAAQCGISERQLRRLERENLSAPLPVLQTIAKVLGVTVKDIAFAVPGPRLVSGNTSPVATARTDQPEFVHIPRHTTTSLTPIAGAQALYEMAKSSMEIVPHVLVDAAPAQMGMIEECLEILKAISEGAWSCGRPVAPDAHDEVDFPEASRRRRLAEIFVLLKGHDIRIVADSEIYHYPSGATPWLEGQSFCNHLVVAFAPRRGEYEEERITVPFDGGRDLVLPYKLPSF